MKFKFYDIITLLVPGFTTYVVTLYYLNIDYDKNFVLPATAIAFIVGFFVNTLSSWLEDFYYITWGGKPSSRLIEGRSIWKVPFYEADKVRSKLNDESDKDNPTSDELFMIAFRTAVKEKNERISDFNANYAFSRIILTTVIITSVLICSRYYTDYRVYLSSVGLIFVAWLRCKQRGYYFAREVLNTYLSSKQEEDDK
jgi:hypothetical protein